MSLKFVPNGPINNIPALGQIVAFVLSSKWVSNIGFITAHGLNEGHIAPYTDIEFQLTKYQKYITMKSQNKSLQLIIEETITLLTKIKHIKQMALKIFHNRIKSRLYNKKAEYKYNLAIHLKHWT